MSEAAIPTVDIAGIDTPASVIGYGTYHLLDKVTPLAAIDSLEAAYEAGITLIDTSDNYGTEQLVGQAISAGTIAREGIVIATKTGLGTTRQEQQAWNAANRPCNTSPQRVRRQLDKSLAALGEEVGAIDLYQLHAYDPQVAPEAHAALMTELIAAGKIKAWGVSNYGRAELAALVQACDQRGLTRPATAQPFLNMVSVYHADVPAAAQAQGLTVLAHSPLLKGALTDNGLAAVTAVMERRKTQTDKEEQAVITRMEPAMSQLHHIAELARERELTLAQVALAWVLQAPNTIALTTPTNPAYLEQATAAARLSLDAELAAAITTLRADPALELVQTNAHHIIRNTRGY